MIHAGFELTNGRALCRRPACREALTEGIRIRHTLHVGDGAGLACTICREPLVAAVRVSQSVLVGRR